MSSQQTKSKHFGRGLVDMLSGSESVLKSQNSSAISPVYLNIKWHRILEDYKLAAVTVSLCFEIEEWLRRSFSMLENLILE